MNPGSSPHTRGTRIPRHPSSPKIRFIPACAGNAGSGVSSSSVSPVHPRMRGERSAGGRPAWACLGSSPHARGTRQGVPPLSEALRVIPACAGNAGTSPASTARHSVHPRMRGERETGTDRLGRVYGSSPHARGTPHRSTRTPCAGRFIPACAGNACGHPAAGSRIPVHPRMRGERHLRPSHLLQGAGSSPHARGTRFRYFRARIIRRFIPACAGNAWCGFRTCRPTSVHPRMRGERGAGSSQAVRHRGSSPHARGTLSCQPS